jgi:hypothetical protein
MKKGTNPSQILRLIYNIKDKNPSLVISSNEFKNEVIDEYNRIYSISSIDTIVSNLREDAILHFQDEYKLIKLPQDNNKVDIMGAKLVDGQIKIIVSQQKGNNGSFNSTSFQKTLEQLQLFYDKKLVKKYFNLLPDNLNPDKINVPYDLFIIIGMTIACGDDVVLDKKRNIVKCSNGNYLRKMGIINNDMVDLDHWIVNQDKVKNHTYDAVSKCHDFNYIYEKCISKLIND